jgi:hypothetical protein
MKHPKLTPYALARIEKARFLEHLTIAIEKTLGIKLALRKSMRKTKGKKVR